MAKVLPHGIEVWTSVTKGTFSDFLRVLGQNESGNNYSFVSSLGYLGRFQFGEEALQLVGFYQGDGESWPIDFRGGWTQKAHEFGVWDKQGFLNSPAAQDAAVAAWFAQVNTDLTGLGLKSYVGQWIGGGQITESGLLAGAHLVGVWSLKSYLESSGSQNTPDPYGTPVAEYVHRFGGYDTPFSGGGGEQPSQPSPPAPTPPGPAGDQVLTAPYPGASLTGGAWTDTLNARQGSGHLTGGGGADTFAFKAMPWTAGRITDFQIGADRLDLSALYANGYRGSDPVADGYVRFVADDAGGAKVMLDVDGPAGWSPISFHVVTLQGVSAGGLTASQVLGGGGPAPSPSPTPTPSPSPSQGGQVLTAPYPGASLSGGAGADTLNASQGGGQVTGGAGADHFVIGAPPWSAVRITDFQTGTDALDLRPLFAQAGYHGGDPRADGYLRLEDNGMGGTTVLFDADGWGSGHPWPITLATLDGVKPWAFGGSDLLFN